jgi:hypothetical protein
MTHLWIHGMYVQMYVCKYVCICLCPTLFLLFFHCIFPSYAWFPYADLFIIFIFRRVCISSGKCLLALACLSVRPHLSTWLPLDGFPWTLLLETFIKICPRDPNVVKIKSNQVFTWIVSNLTHLPICHLLCYAYHKCCLL